MLLINIYFIIYMYHFLPIPNYSHGDILKWKKTNIHSLHIRIQNNKPTFTSLCTNFKDRIEIMKKMIQDTLLLYNINDVEIIINVTDKPNTNLFMLHFSRTTNCNINVVPFFSFYKWGDAQSNDFYETKNKIIKNSREWALKEDKIMWSGSNTSKIRRKMNQLKDNTNYKYNLILDKINKKFIKLEDHTNYKYILDMEGIGYSGRVPYLLLTGSCVIILENVDNDYKYHFDSHFQEDVHYLKIRYNDNDCVNTINDLILNKIKSSNCEEIAQKCQRVAIDVFTKDNILLYFKELLDYYSSYYHNITEELNNSIPYQLIHYTTKKKLLIMNKFCK